MIGFDFHKWSSSLLMVAAGSGLLIAKQHSQLASEYKALQATMEWVSKSTRQEAQEAFEAGRYRQAAALLESVVRGGNNDKELNMLHARTLECVGRFSEAAEAYRLAGAQPNPPPLAECSRTFCLRMASERKSTPPGSTETLYRLHEELMRRRQFGVATCIAQQLLPDIEPLRNATTALLRLLDREAKIETAPKSARLNVTLSKVTKPIVDLLRDVPIETLTVTSAGLNDSAMLAGLQVHALNLNFNPLGDIAALRSMPLRKLDLSDTHVADVRALAGLPLRELDLSHTHVTYLLPLGISPLERLGLAGLPIRSIRDLAGLALRDLDLSHTQVCDLSPLASMPLESLRLDGCMVRDLRPLAGSRLKRLSLARTAVTDLSPLAGLPLEELDLRGCELLADLSTLSNCPKLVKLGLPRHLKEPTDLASLPLLRFIVQDKVWTDKTVGHVPITQALGVL